MNSVSKSAIVICAIALLSFVMLSPATATPVVPNLSAGTDTAPSGPTSDDSLRTLQTNAETLRAEIQTSTVTDSTLAALREQAAIMAEHFAKLQASLQNSRAVLARMPNSGDKLQRLETLATQVSARHTQLQDAVSAALAEPIAANIQELLQVIQTLIPPERNQPIGVNLPHRLTHFDPVEPVLGAGGGLAVYGGKIILPAGITSFDAPPTDADLLPSIETVITPEIAELAAMLQHDPISIYSWVHDNIDYEPYYGSLKGGALTLSDRSGNDADQASLLISLLRASGIHSRYVYGTLTIPIEDLMQWLSIPDPNNAYKMMSTRTGVPIAAGFSGDSITEVTIEHMWIVAWIDWIPSGGAVHRVGDNWIPMDPSMKRYSNEYGIDVSLETHFDAMAYLSGMNDSQPISEYYKQVVRHLSENNSETTSIYNAIDKRMIIPNSNSEFAEDISGISNTLIGIYSEMPDILRHKWSFQLDGILTTVSLCQIGKSEITLTYVPASNEDNEIIKEYGGLFLTPPYILSLKPELDLDNAGCYFGQAIGCGEHQDFTMTYIYPGNRIIEKITNMVKAGGYYGIAVILNQVSSKNVADNANTVSAIVDRMNNGDSDSSLDEASVKGTLYLSALDYFYNLMNAEKILSYIMHIRNIKQPSEAMFGIDVNTTYSLGIPFDIFPAGLFLDVDRNVSALFPTSGDIARNREYMLLAGYNSSYLEHKLIENYHNQASISTIKALQIANSMKIPLFTINRDNISSIIPLLEYSPSFYAEISDYVNNGYEVLIPKRELIVDDWNGIGYIVNDPVTNSAAYLISGGYAGSASVQLREPLNTVASAKEFIGQRVPVYLSRRHVFVWGYDEVLGTAIAFMQRIKYAAIIVSLNTGEPVESYSSYLGGRHTIAYTTEEQNQLSKYYFNRLIESVHDGVFVYFGHGTSRYDGTDPGALYIDRSNDLGEKWVSFWHDLELESDITPKVCFLPADLNKSLLSDVRFVFFASCFSAKAWTPFFESGSTSFLGFNAKSDYNAALDMFNDPPMVEDKAYSGVIDIIGDNNTLFDARRRIQDYLDARYPGGVGAPGVIALPLTRLGTELREP